MKYCLSLILLTRSAKGGSRIGKTRLLKNTYFFWKASATNWKHTNDLEAYEKMFCWIWVHFEINFVSIYLNYSGSVTADGQAVPESICCQVWCSIPADYNLRASKPSHSTWSPFCRSRTSGAKYSFCRNGPKNLCMTKSKKKSSKKSVLTKGNNCLFLKKMNCFVFAF